jgi:small-conductance mechanosensitive channel
VLKRFHDAGIEIPFPQRDVRITSVSNAVPLTIVPGASGGAGN